MSELKDKTINGVIWSAIEKFSVQGVVFFVGLIMARLLTPEDFGVVGMLTIFLSISQTFVDSGFSNALIRKIDRTDVDCSTVFYFNVVIGFLCFSLLYLFSPLIADFYNTPQLVSVTRVLALTLLLNSLIVVQVALFTIRIDFKTQAKINLTGAIISGFLGIYLAYSGFGVWALVYQTVLRSVINVIMYWSIARWKPLFVFSLSSFHELFSFGSKLLISSLLHTCYLNMANMVIGRFYSAKDLGYYERGQQFGKLPEEATVSVFQRVTFPVLSTIQNDDRHLIATYRKLMKTSSIIIFFVMFLLIVLAKPFVIVLLTEKWEQSVIYLQLYCFANMFNHITRLNLILLQVKGRSDLFLKLEIVKKSISLIMLISSAPFGIIAICISQIVYTQIAVFINTYYTKKFFNLGWLSQVKDFSKYFVLSLLATLSVYFIVLLNFSNILIIFGGPVVAFIIYSLLLAKDSNYIELRCIVMNSLRQIRTK